MSPRGAEADLVHDDEVVAQQSVDDLADGHDVCWATDLGARVGIG